MTRFEFSEPILPHRGYNPQASSSEEAITRHAITVVSLKILGIIRFAMLAAGIAALLAAAVTWMLAREARHEWAASLVGFSFVFAFAVLAASTGASLLMPTADLTRSIRRDESASVPALAVLLTALAGAALLQLPLLVSWWAQDRALLVDAVGGGPDPLGFRMVPAAILFSLPSLAAATVVTCVLTSLLGVLVRADLAVQVLMSCAAMQTGLVSSIHLFLWGFRETGAQMLALLDEAGDPLMSARVTQWLAAHDALSTPISWRLVWILGGYLAAVAVGELLTPRRHPGRAAEPNPFGPDGPPPPAAPIQAHVTISSASSAFDYSNYSVRPRPTFLESLIFRSYAEYDIQTIPPSSRSRFSFSWKTGFVRREPEGPDLVKLQRAGRQGLLGSHSYVVTDAVMGTPLGTLVPNLSEWEILDPFGGLIGRVQKETVTPGFTSYVAIVNEQIVCRFTWGMPELLSHSSELEVEFLPGPPAPYDKAFMIALAPILEHKIRMASERAISGQAP